MSELEVHPLFQLKAKARLMKQELDYFKMRSTALDDQQKVMAKDISDMDAAVKDIDSMVADYTNKEQNLRILHGQLSSFVTEQSEILVDKMPAAEIEKLDIARKTVLDDIETKQKSFENAQKPAKEHEDALSKKKELLSSRQEKFEDSKTIAKAWSSNLEDLRALMEQVKGTDDPKVKYVLTKEIKDNLGLLPGRDILKATLTAELHRLLAVKAEHYEAARLATEAKNKLDSAHAELLAEQTNRRVRLLAAAQGPAPIPAEATPQAAKKQPV